MHRVPPGFNDLVAHKANEAVDVIRASVVPLFRTDRELRPVFEGSGVLVRIYGLELIASAAHVFDEMRDGGVHLLLEGRETQALSDPMRVTVGARPEQRLSDTLDVGFVRLSSAEAEAAGRSNFIEVRPRILHSEVRWHLRYIVLGFSAKDQLRLEDESLYRTTQTYYTTSELRRNKYRISGVDENTNIALDFNHRTIAGEGGRGGRPNFAGMSGGGIWEIDPYDNYSTSNLPALVGFLAGPAPNNKKALFGASTTAFLELVRSMKTALEINPHGG